MAEVREFRLPDVGEGLTEAEVIGWHVAVGDHVAVNQVLVEIETAKAAVELPSPFAGVVTALLVEAGTVVPVGTPLISVAVGVDAAAATEPEQWAAAAAPAAPEAKREAVLVGYGVAPSSLTRRPRRGSTGTTDRPDTEAPDLTDDLVPALPVEDSSVALRRGGFEVANAAAARVAGGRGHAVRAKPPVRMRAKELGVDLDHVTPTGPHGDVTRADVEGASALAGRGAPADAAAGGEERIAVRGVARAMADAMVRSAAVPHVTEWVAVDVSGSVRLADRLRTLPELEGATVGPTLVAAWALCRAARRHPRINARWDEDTDEIVVRHQVNLGVAAATPRGLVVPVVKDAGALDLAGLAHALTALTTAARAGTTAPTDMLGGSITMTNVGVFGVDGGTPMLVPGQGAILCLGQVAERAWVVDGAVVARPVCELTLSFDHRFVDGELGSRFLADVAATMTDPTAELARASLR